MKTTPGRKSWLWRCAECGHGRNLVAWSEGVIEGPLAHDGTISRYDYIEDTWVFPDSIHCTLHVDAIIEFKVDGRFRRWSQCERCKGRGEVILDSWRDHRRRCSECGGKGGEWVLPELAVR